MASVAAKVAISVAAQAERAGERHGEAGGIRQAVRHKPHGVLAVLGPYNFPAHLPNGHIVPALLAGNAVVFKPSEQAPAVGDFMAGCWAAAGLPAGVLTLVQGGRRAGRGARRGRHRRPAVHRLGDGGGGAGAALRRDAASILALEMGGNNPLVAWDIAARTSMRRRRRSCSRRSCRPGSAAPARGG